MNIYRWDLDRTYLETEIHSTMGLIRAGLERAEDKRTVPGADSLLRGLVEADPTSRLCFLSGSPRQLQRVLLRKLELDGLRVDSLILKDNLRNLRRGRFRAVRAQVGYKLPFLLEDRVGTPPQACEWLFGDDSETDAVIYASYAELLAGRLGSTDLQALLERRRAYPDAIAKAQRALAQLEPADAIKDIFIRIDRGMPIALFRTLGRRVKPVFSWWQAALVLHAGGRLDQIGLVEVARQSGFLEQPKVLASLAQDAVRRWLVSRTTLDELLTTQAFSHAREEIRYALSVLPDHLPPAPPEQPDIHAFLDGLDAHHERRRKRRRARKRPTR